MNRVNITISSLTKNTWTRVYQFIKCVVYNTDLKSKEDSFTNLQSVTLRIMIETDPVTDAKTGDGVDLNLSQIKLLSTDTCFGLIYQKGNDDEDFTGLVPFILLQHEFKDAISLGIDIGLLESSKHSSYPLNCRNFFYLIENNPPKLGNNSIYIINEIKIIDKSSDVIEYVSPNNRISRLKGKGASGYSGVPSRRFLPLIKITESNFGSIFVKNEPCDSKDLSFVLESIDKIKQNLESNKAIKTIWPHMKLIFEESQSPFEQWLASGYFYSLGEDLKGYTRERIESVRKTLQIYKNSVIELVQNIIFHAGKEGIFYCVFDEKNNVKKGYGESILDFDTYKDNTRFLRVGVFDYSEKGIVDTFCDYLKTNPYPSAAEDINSLSLRCFFDTKSIVVKGLTHLEMRYAARLGIKAFVKTIIDHKGFFSVESNYFHNGSGKKQIQTVLTDNVITLSPEEESVFVNGTHYEIVLPIIANDNDIITPVQSISLMANSYFNVINEKKTPFSWLIKDTTDFDFSYIFNSTNKNEQIKKIEKVGEKVIDEVCLRAKRENKNYDGIVWDFEGKELDFNIVFKLVSFLQLNSNMGFKRIILVNTTERFIKGLYDLLNVLILGNEDEVWNKESAIIVYSENLYSMIIWGKTKNELYYINQESQKFNYNYFFQESSIIDWNSKSALNSIDNKTKELVQQFVLPYDILINTGKENKASLFECFLNRLLKRKINPNNLGFLVNHENTYTGNKIIVKNYYEADTMFQNNYFTERFAYVIAQNIKNKIISKNQRNKKLVIIGYNHYSEVLLKSIEMWLKIKSKDGESSVIKEVNLVIFIEEKDAFANDFSFDFDIDKKQNVENNIFKNPEEFLFVTIVPIGSILSINDKIIARFRQWYKRGNIKSNKKEGDCANLFLLEDERFIYNHCVVVVRDSDGADVSVQEIGQRWEGIDLSERVIRTRYTNAKEIHYSTLVAKATGKNINNSNWATRLNKEISFTYNWWAEEYVNYTENSSINSQNLMGFPRIEASELNEDNHSVELDRLFDLKDDIYKGHIEMQNCHHKYYVDAEKFVKRNNVKLDKWLQEEVKADEVFNQDHLNIIITPNVERESDLIFKIKELIFNGNALIIYMDVDNWRSNMVHKLSYLKNIQKTSVKFHYVDPTFLSDEKYHKSKSYLFSILDDTTVGFATIITIVNRLSYAKNQEVQNDVKDKFFSFIKLHYPGSKEGGHGCDLCQLDEYYKKLSSRTVLDSCNDVIIKNCKKLVVVQKNKIDSKQCSKRGFIRLVLTHEIYYRIAEIVQQYSKAYNYDSIYSNMETELNGIFEQLSQYRPLPEKGKAPKSIINHKIDDWLTLKCMDIQGDLSGEMNAVFMEKLRVDKKISFLKVISSPPLSKYIAIRKYAYEKLLNELHLLISRTDDEKNDFVYDDLKITKSILKSLSFLKSNALVRKEVIVGVWRVLSKVLCNLKKERSKIEKYLQIIEKYKGEINNSISQPQQILISSDYSDGNINDDIKKIEVLKDELEKDLERLNETEIIRNFSRDVQFFIKNSIVEDDAKSTFLGELLRQGNEMTSFDDISLSRTILSSTRNGNSKSTIVENELFEVFFNCNDDILRREYTLFLVKLFYDNNITLRKTLNGFSSESFTDERISDVFFVPHLSTVCLKSITDFKKDIVKIKNVIVAKVKEEYYYSSFLPYLTNFDGIDFVEKLIYVTYAKFKLEDLTVNKRKTFVEVDTRELMEILSAIMGADAAFLTMRKTSPQDNGKSNSTDEGSRIYPISIFDEDYENKWDYNLWNMTDSYYTYQVYSQKVRHYPLLPIFGINNHWGENRDLNKHSLVVFPVIDNQKRWETDSQNSNVASCITFLYKDDNPLVSDERTFKINQQESGKLLLLLSNYISQYIVGYLLREKVFELWEKAHLSSRRFEKIYANSSHVFSSVYKEMDEFENLDEVTIKKLSRTWFYLTNETISFMYSSIEKNPMHYLDINPFFVVDQTNTLGKTFNNTFICILSALLNSRWRAERDNVKNVIYINDERLDLFKMNDELINVPINCNKHLIRTFVAQCLHNSLSPLGNHGHRYGNEIKRVDIVLSESELVIKDSCIIKIPQEVKAEQAKSFLRKKKYIQNLECDDYSSTTLTSLQGVSDYLQFSCDYGFNKDNNFKVIIKFSKRYEKNSNYR